MADNGGMLGAMVGLTAFGIYLYEVLSWRSYCRNTAKLRYDDEDE